jgi:hypothetical protein
VNFVITTGALAESGVSHQDISATLAGQVLDVLLSDEAGAGRASPLDTDSGR